VGLNRLNLLAEVFVRIGPNKQAGFRASTKSLIIGESGSGKSRLALEFARQRDWPFYLHRLRLLDSAGFIGRLPWTYQAANGCPIHKTMLEFACPCRGTATNRNVKRPAWLFCGWGSKHCTDPPARAAGADEVGYAAQISDLLAKGFEKPDIKMTRLREVVQTTFIHCS
jgi:hypothetical protein